MPLEGSSRRRRGFFRGEKAHLFLEIPQGGSHASIRAERSVLLGYRRGDLRLDSGWAYSKRGALLRESLDIIVAISRGLERRRDGCLCPWLFLDV